MDFTFKEIMVLLIKKVNLKLLKIFRKKKLYIYNPQEESMELMQLNKFMLKKKD